MVFSFLGLQTGAMLTVRCAGKDFVQAKPPENPGSAHTVITTLAVPTLLPEEAFGYINGHLDHRGFFSPLTSEGHCYTSIFFWVEVVFTTGSVTAIKVQTHNPTC